jgi:hypothetical protein
MKNVSKEVLEALGVVGVIASLAFVGVQLMLDRNVAMGNAYHERNESRKADLRTRLESEAIAQDLEWRVSNVNYRPAWWNDNLEGLHNERGIPVSLLIRINQQRALDIMQVDNLIYQYELGLIDSSFMDEKEVVWKRFVDDSMMYAALSTATVRPQTLLWFESLGYDIQSYLTED